MPSSVAVRPLTDDDDLVALSAVTPQPWLVEWWRDLERAGGIDLHWRVGLLDGQPVGLGVVCPMPFVAGGYGPAVVGVAGSARRRGVASALRRELEDLARGIVPGVAYTVLVGDHDAEAALEAWGLAVSTVHHESTLDLLAVDREDFERRAGVAGLDVATLPDLATLDDAVWHAFHEFTQARFEEAPDAADGGGLLPYEVFRSGITEPWMLATARRDGDLVGITLVSARAGDAEAANTFFTGVAPAARGGGVATALKCRQALSMADAGVRRLHTQNMDGNEPILAANRTMGFAFSMSYADVPVPLSTASGPTS